MQIISVLAPNCLKILHLQISWNSIISLNKSVIIWACKLLNIQDCSSTFHPTSHTITTIYITVTWGAKVTDVNINSGWTSHPVWPIVSSFISAAMQSDNHYPKFVNYCSYILRYKAKTENTSNACTKFALSEPSVKECSWRENWCWLVAEVTETHSFMRSGVHSRGAEDSSLLGFHNVRPGKFTHPPWKHWNLFTSQHGVTFYRAWIFR